MEEKKLTQKERRDILNKVIAELQPTIEKIAKDYEEGRLKGIERLKFRISEAERQGRPVIKKLFEDDLAKLESQDSRAVAEGLVRWHIGMHRLGLRVKGQPYLKKINKKGQIKYATSTRDGDKVETKYVGVYLPETVAFAYIDKEGKEKVLSFEKNEMLYNKIDLFKLWMYGGRYKEKEMPAIRTDWNWGSMYSEEFDAFDYFWKALKGNLPLLGDFGTKKAFEFKVRVETGQFLKKNVGTQDSQ